MAEATLAPVNEAPPEAAEVIAPEVSAEPASSTDNQEEGTNYDAILEGLGTDDEGEGGTDGAGAAADGAKGPSTTESQTPEQIREQARKEVEAESKQAQDAAARASYLAGLNNVVKDLPTRLAQFVKDNGLPVEALEALQTEFQRLNGAYRPLYDHELQRVAPEIQATAYRQAEGEVSTLLYDTIKEDLGDTALKNTQQAKSWPDLAKAIVKEARKGYITPEQAKAERTKLLGKIDKALEGHNLSLAAITGNGGSNSLSPRGGSGGAVSSLAQYNAATMEQRAAWDKADPKLLDRLIERDGSRG